MATSALPVTFDHPSGPRDLLAAKAGRVRFLSIPEIRHLAVDGGGAPGGDEFRAAFGALYPVAYTLHFALKRRGVAAPVGTLEGLYRFDAAEPGSPDTPSSADDRLGGGAPPWTWRLMLPVPPEAADAEIDAAIAEVARTKAPPALARLQVLRWKEGPSAQILHVGPYDAETATIEFLHRAIADAGLRPHGDHHEIYVSDPNRTAPERLKTVIRQPVESGG